MHTQTLCISIIFCFIAGMLNGCVNANTQASRFYVLNAIQNSQNESAKACQKDKNITVGINPIDLPRYLDRPQIMTRCNENELKLSEFDLWAEPLKDNVTHVIAQNLNALLCADVHIFPWSGSKQITHRLSMEVIRLDGSPGDKAFLDVRWSIYDEQAQKVIFTKESRFTETSISYDYNALVSSYSRLFTSFSQEIAEALKSISQGR